MSSIARTIRSSGRAFGRILAEPVGAFLLLLRDAFSTPRDFARYRDDFLVQMRRVGIDSLPVVMLAAAFTGAVTTLQSIYQMTSPLIPRSTIGAVVVPTIILELGVIITAFILAGRVGARMAAEIASMRVNEQIDALEVMGLNASGYLVAPRVVAGTLMLPILYVAACGVGSAAGYLAAAGSDFLTTQQFIEGARQFFTTFSAFYGTIKAVVFGFIITSVACYQGFTAEGGAEGVGRSATRAAVLSCVYVLVADFVLASTLL
jgi:phospholipid/cholesterol/gamma-HCH transport system permease protein